MQKSEHLMHYGAKKLHLHSIFNDASGILPFKISRVILYFFLFKIAAILFASVLNHWLGRVRKILNVMVSLCFMPVDLHLYSLQIN